MINNQQQQTEFWDKKANTNFINPVNMEKVQQFIPNKQARILEYGCGYGRVLNSLSQEGYQQLFGMDFSGKMIERGKKEYSDLNLLWIKGEDIPLADNSVDAVFLFTVLTCIYRDQDQNRLVKEIKRILTKNGVVYLSDFLISHDTRNLQRYAQYENKYHCYGVFELEEEGICRHHELSYIKELFDDFRELWYTNQGIATLSGHPGNPFQMIMQLNDDI
jgi:ubiquinone/menaquinone biosynthesis C-methylase UbiE